MTEPLVLHEGLAVALLRANVDTDAIIPSREMKTVGKTGLADGLFAPWRYLDADARTPNPEFVLNRPEAQGASILLAGPNFGCGSSREHAVWALKEYGFRVIIAPSFGAIFAANCVRNGLLPAVLPEAVVQALAGHPNLRVDIANLVISAPDGAMHAFPLTADNQEMLLTGLDAISRTLTFMPQIDAFEAHDRLARPWAYV